MRNIILSLLLIFVATVSQAQDSEASTSRKRMQQALAFLEANPDSPRAAAIRMETYMLAVVLGETNVADQLKRELIYQNPKSLYAHYMVHQHENAKAYREFLQSCMKQPPERFIRDMRGFHAALVLGFGAFGPQTIETNELRLTALFLSQILGDTELWQQLTLQLKPTLASEDTPDKEANAREQAARATFALLQDNKLSPVERVTRYHAVPDYRPARLIEEYYLGIMSEELRETPEIWTIRVENFLRREQPEQALALLESPPVEMTAKLQFWKAYCLASLLRHDEALALLKAVSGGEAKWIKASRTYHMALAQREQAIKQHTEAFLALVNRLRGGLDVVEGWWTVSHDQGPPMKFYLAMDPEKQYLEILVFDGHEPLFMFRTTAKSSRFYAAGDDRILQVAEPVKALPTPTIGLRREADGSFSMSVNLGQVDNVAELAEVNREILESKYTTTTEGVHAMLSQLAKANVPMLPQQTERVRQYSWILPHPLEGRLETLTIGLAADGSIDFIESKKAKVYRLQYGKRDEVSLKPPKWPELPVQEADEMDPALFMGMFARFMQLLNKL